MSFLMCSRFVIITLHTVCDVQYMRHWILIGLQKIHILYWFSDKLYISQDSLVFLSVHYMALNIGTQNERFIPISSSLNVNIYPKYL